MGEYAELEILRLHGIDIKYENKATKNKMKNWSLYISYENHIPKKKSFPCSCGKLFYSEYARNMHQSATGHKPSKQQLKQNVQKLI